MQKYPEAAEATDAAWAEIVGPLRSARERIDSGYEELRERRDGFVSEQNGHETDVDDDDILEINAGGQTVMITRETMTQCEGTLLESLFGGRWESRLQRDGRGRVFLDVNPNCFRSIVDYLIERRNSLPDDPPDPPQVQREDEQILGYTMYTFGLDGGLEASPQRKTRKANPPEEWETMSFDGFPVKLRDALAAEQQILITANRELRKQQALLHREKAIIDFFTGGDAQEVVWLNVRGKLMATKRSTLGLCEESVLAKQFNDPKWAKDQESPSEQEARGWNPEQVADWAQKIQGMPQSVAESLYENEVNGIELLAVRRDDMNNMGITRAGTQALLMEAIESLQSTSGSSPTFIDQSPYCFEKIVDHLRLRAMCQSPLQDLLPAPYIRKSHQDQFKEVVDYYFPGQYESFMLRFGSSTILSISEIEQIETWLEEEDVHGRFELLYCASRDGWRAADFHSRCDDKGATVTVIQSASGHVFGGFADVPWASSGNYTESPHAFLFALRTHSGLGPMKMRQSENRTTYAVCHHSLWGPVFGGGHDIRVGDNANTTSNSKTSIGNTYQCPPGNDGEKFLTGSLTFRASEVEVFRVS